MDSLRRIMPPPTSRFTAVCTVLAQLDGCFTLVHAPEGCTPFFASDFATLGVDDHSVANVGIEHQTLTFGAEDRVSDALIAVDRARAPRVIALVAGPVSGLVGADLDGAARSASSSVKAEVLVFDCKAMEGNATEGEEAVYASVAERVAGASGAPGGGVNLLGMGVMEANLRSDMREVERLVQAMGLPVLSRLGPGGSLSAAAERAGDAAVNLVLSESAVRAAETLERRFGTPWVAGLPFGFQGTRQWMEQVARLAGADAGPCLRAEEERFGPVFELLLERAEGSLANRVETLRAAVTGPRLYATALARFLTGEIGLEVEPLVVTTHGAKADLPEGGLWNPTEREMEAALAERPPDLVLGDTFFHRLCGPDLPFVAVTHPDMRATRWYDDAPYLGFRGAVHLTETLLNGVNRGDGFSRLHARRRT